MNLRRITIHAFAAGIVTGSFLTAGIILIASPAHADTTLAQDAVDAEPYICNMLAASPSPSQLIVILERVSTADNLSPYDSGYVVGAAVQDGCAQFVPVLQRFSAIYGTHSGTTA